MKINNREELYKYLDRIDYNKYKESNMSDVYFMLKEEDSRPYVVTFLHFEGSYFECPQELIRFPLQDKELKDYIIDNYSNEYFNEALEYEKKFQLNGYHYEINGWQVEPWIEKLEDIKPITESECLKFMLDHSEYYL